VRVWFFVGVNVSEGVWLGRGVGKWEDGLGEGERE